MNFEIVKLERFSGSKATIYSVILENDEDIGTTLFDHFVSENSSLHGDEVIDITKRLIAIGQSTGLREIYLKPNEGNFGDGVCALYDNPDKNLRLYCIRFSNTVLIIGGGGHKPKSMRALQENKKLTEENSYMRIISEKIGERILSKDIIWSKDGTELLGDFIFNDDE